MKGEVKLGTSSFSVVVSQFFPLVQGLLISCNEESETNLDRLFFLMKQNFMVVEQSIGRDVMYGEVKIFMMLLNMSKIH